MTRSSVLLLALGLVLALASSGVGSQRSGPSMAALVNLLRFQNTACHSDQEESGTCLSDNECARRAGISIGTCANGYGSCCSFKVSLQPVDFAPFVLPMIDQRYTYREREMVPSTLSLRSSSLVAAQQAKMRPLL